MSTYWSSRSNSSQLINPASIHSGRVTDRLAGEKVVIQHVKVRRAPGEIRRALLHAGQGVVVLADGTVGHQPVGMVEESLGHGDSVGAIAVALHAFKPEI